MDLIDFFKTLENKFSAKPLLSWRKVPTQETKDCNRAEDDTRLGKKNEQVTNIRMKVNLTKLKVVEVTGKTNGESVT